MGYMVSIKESKNLSIDKNIHDFLNPDYIYVPIYEDDVILVKDNNPVDKEQAIIKRNGEFIYSTVSGTLIGKTSKMNVHNTNIECLVIENDYKEHVKKRKGAIRYINEYSKEDLLKQLSLYNACDVDLSVPAKTILVSGIDVDPFEKNNSFIVNAHIDKILDTMDALSQILGIDNTIIAINTSDSNNVLNLNNNIGTYPNITLKLVTNNYPIGFKNILINHVLNKHQQQEGVIYLSVYDVYNIYNVLKRKKPILEKFITVSGDCIDSPMVVNTKIGTTMIDLIKNTCNITNENYYVIVNGLIAGETLGSLDTVITSDIKSIFLNTRDTSPEKKCINCGLCNKKCPMGLNPKYIKDHKNADHSRCIGCGLCSYVCPSKINFKPYVGGRNEE